MATLISAVAQVKFGVTAGLNLSTMSQNEASKRSSYDAKSRFGPRFGAVAQVATSEKTLIRGGLIYSKKGYRNHYKDAFGNQSSEVNIDVAISYLEIPVTGVYRFGKFEFHAGPYVAIGLHGKYDYSLTETDWTNDTETFTKKWTVGFTRDLTWADRGPEPESDKYYFKPLDLGINAGIGYDVGSGLINLTYTRGLLNVYPDNMLFGNDQKMSNTVVNASFTYFFGRQKS